MGYELLAEAIILQAVEDYRDALKRLKKTPSGKRAKDNVTECEQFFRSDWFTILTNADGEYLIREIRKGVKNS